MSHACRSEKIAAMPLLRSVVLLTLVLACTPAVAEAQTTYLTGALDGLTGQRKPIRLLVGPDGRVSDFKIPWASRTCLRPPSTFSGDTSADGRLLLSTPQRFVERIVVRDRDETEHGTFDSRIEVEVRGRRLGSAKRWAGTITASSVVRRSGSRKVYDRCRLRPLAWRAGAASASLQMSSEPDNWVGAEEPLAFDHTGSTVSSFVHLHGQAEVRFDVPQEGFWTVRLRPLSDGRGLRVGRYTGDVVEVSGDGRGCGTPIIGELVVERVVLDRHRLVRELVASFTQRCTYDQGRLTGRLTFDRGY